MTNDQSIGRQAMGSEAPKLAQLTDQVLYGDIWERPQLSKRERSIATVAALVAMYRVEQLPFHLDLALKHGVGKDELAEIVTHLAFYCGWPAAHSAVRLLAPLRTDP